MDLEMLKKKKLQKTLKSQRDYAICFKICSKPTVIEICDVRVEVEGQ